MAFFYLHVKHSFVIWYLAMSLKIIFQIYVIRYNAYTQLYLDLALRAG